MKLATGCKFTRRRLHLREHKFLALRWVTCAVGCNLLLHLTLSYASDYGLDVPVLFFKTYFYTLLWLDYFTPCCRKKNILASLIMNIATSLAAMSCVSSAVCNHGRFELQVVWGIVKVSSREHHLFHLSCTCAECLKTIEKGWGSSCSCCS